VSLISPVVKYATAIALALGFSTAHAADKPEIRIGFNSGWDDSVATSNVAAQIIEQRLGYPVKLQPAEAAIMWQGVARGDLDVTLTAWLPATHGEYYAKFKDSLETLGTNYEGAKIGLVVPDYVEATSIEELNAQKSEFGGRITGIDAGAGIMQRTEAAIDAYDLDYNLMPSSGPAMAVALGRAISAKKPIIVTGWIPHWKFAKWDLHFLEDPKGVFGEAEHVDTLANPALAKKAPDVANFLRKFQWKSKEIGEVMLAISEGAKPEQAAKDWIAKHPDRVEEWLK
jgi:glycine betaine/proline transport system substrate-binding protein